MTNLSDIELSLNRMMKGITDTIPKIRVNHEKVPAGTKKLYLILEDTNFGNFPHGLHLFDFNDSDIILEDEFKILPLNPPGDQSHQYRLTVRAYDGDHEVIGVEEVTQQFP